jgi:hypothetical protein
MASGPSVEYPELDTLETLTREKDPRYLLVQRILATPDFIRSAQLSKFLLYISTATFEGRQHTLSEQHIGVAVFGREPDYDSAADTIVRSHALRLRRRLEQFFQKAGRQEPIRLVIPRGGYVPLFSPRDGDPSVSSETGPLEPKYPDFPRDEAVTPDHAAESLLPPHPVASTPDLPARDAIRILWRYRIATASLAILCVFLLVAMALHLQTHLAIKRHHILWGRLFTDDQPTQIVLGDSGLVLFHAVARQYVSLHDYLSDDVSKQMPSVQHVDPAFARFLLHRRYTSMVDATTLTRLLRLPEAVPNRTLIHYSRDIHLNDFKNGNVIMIGAQEAVPWVELFETHMDFPFSIDNPDKHASFLNRHPHAGELAEYNSVTPATRTKVYSVIAFVPNLSATGNVLILEGLSTVGTEAAVDLAMDDDRLLPILEPLRRPNGSLPHFEMLLESDTLGESAGPARVIALHRHD